MPAEGTRPSAIALETLKTISKRLSYLIGDCVYYPVIRKTSAHHTSIVYEYHHMMKDKRGDVLSGLGKISSRGLVRVVTGRPSSFGEL